MRIVIVAVRYKYMEVKFKRLSEDSVLPSYSKSGDAGLDLTAISNPIYDDENSIRTYRTGLAVEIPEGYVGLIFPRSSIYKKGLVLANSVGVIDSGYRGEILVKFANRMGAGMYYFGDRIAQLIIMPIPVIEPVEAEELSDTERGEGGFGSTNEK